MAQIVSAFQLGSSTVVTIPKSMGIKPGQKFEVRKSKNGAAFKLSRNKTLLEVLDEAREAFKDVDWEAYDKEQKIRRRVELRAAKKMREAW